MVTDMLEIEVRHKWNSEVPSVSHFLGKVCLPVARCITSAKDNKLVSLSSYNHISRNRLSPTYSGKYFLGNSRAVAS